MFHQDLKAKSHFPILLRCSLQTKVNWSCQKFFPPMREIHCATYLEGFYLILLCQSHDYDCRAELGKELLILRKGNGAVLGCTRSKRNVLWGASLKTRANLRILSTQTVPRKQRFKPAAPLAYDRMTPVLQRQSAHVQKLFHNKQHDELLEESILEN